jgi:hypothetical protein
MGKCGIRPWCVPMLVPNEMGRGFFISSCEFRSSTDCVGATERSVGTTQTVRAFCNTTIEMEAPVEAPTAPVELATK